MTDEIVRLKEALGDRYAIEHEIGAGGMAVVYLAEDAKHHRKVAVKVLRPEIASALGAERFVREIEIAANLSHPLILPLHDSGDAGGNLYYVMPFVDGESLRDRIDREGKLPLDEAIRLTENVAAALTYAHKQGIVHRDIKPENIMLTGGSAVVADFGIARALTVAGGTKLTETGVAIGTPAYMSPEQAFGDANIDGRSDVYALGCVVYEMVSGRTPFEASTPQAMLAKHAVDTPRGLRTIDSEIPLFVDRAVGRAMAKEPAQRFKTPNEFAETLRSQTLVAQTGRRRLAVLPPTNLANDPEQEYFVQGMHNALISELQKVGLAVIARTSVLQYENTQKPIHEIAGELGVDAIVEPSVFRSGDDVELEARVVDGLTEEYLTDPIHRSGELKNVVAMFRELTGAIASEIQVALTPQAKARLATALTVNPEAYEAYLRGQFHWYKMTPVDLQTALKYYDVALRHDSDYAPAYAGIALAWAGLQQMALVPPSEARPQAREAVNRALELDSTLVEVQYAKAVVDTWVEWDWDAADTAFRRAMELNPNFPDVLAYYAHFKIFMKHTEEAMHLMERAMALDPLRPNLQGLAGAALGMVGRTDDAIDQCHTLLKTVPNHPLALGVLQVLYFATGENEKLIESSRGYYEAIEFTQATEALELGYKKDGHRGGMRRVAEVWVEASRATWVPPSQIAYLYVFAEENDKALDWLERAFEEHDPEMPYVGAWPSWGPLRDKPRFKELVRKMGLPE